MKRNEQAGFTLIELLIVVLIIGILAAVALPQYKKVVLKSKVTQIMPYLRAIKDAEEMYYLENGKYTNRTDFLNIEGSCPNDWDCRLMSGGESKVEAIYNQDSQFSLVASFNHRTSPRCPDLIGTIYCYASKNASNSYIQTCQSIGKCLTGCGDSNYRCVLNL